MAKKSSPKRRFRWWKAKLFLALNLLLLVAGGGWYLVQPASRQAEVRMLLGNYAKQNRRISLFDIARDIYTLYYSDAYVATDFVGGENPVYAGNPVPETFDKHIRVLKNRAYVVGYCDELKNPAWVAYRLVNVPGDPEVGERPPGFDTDRRTVARVTQQDYTGSGYDRGHLAPNFGIAHCFGREAQLETFLMSNIVPQKHGMNAGPWKKLELREALNYTGRFEEVWIIAGPLFHGEQKRMKSGVPIPNACYKIQVDEHEGKLRMQAFIMSQDVAENASLSVMLTTVDEVEKLSGLDFFPDLPDDVEEKLEAATPTRVW
jgi:endonuclease G